MKKIYINPETKIVKIQTQLQMLAGSPTDQILDKEGDQIDNGNQVGSRRGSLWDDYDY